MRDQICVYLYCGECKVSKLSKRLVIFLFHLSVSRFFPEFGTFELIPGLRPGNNFANSSFFKGSVGTVQIWVYHHAIAKKYEDDSKIPATSEPVVDKNYRELKGFNNISLPF